MVPKSFILIFPALISLLEQRQDGFLQARQGCDEVRLFGIRPSRRIDGSKFIVRFVDFVFQIRWGCSSLGFLFPLLPVVFLGHLFMELLSGCKHAPRFFHVSDMDHNFSGDCRIAMALIPNSLGHSVQ